jgi:Flp pilus assembly protein CpaB
MNKKVSLLIVSIVLAVVIFVISISLQKQLVNDIPTITCAVANADIPEYSEVNDSNVSFVKMPLDSVANLKIVMPSDNISGKYATSKIYKGQFILYDQLSTKQDLMIFDGEEGKEKISIKIKGPDSGVSYIVKKGAKINLYATIINEYASKGFFSNFEKLSVGTDDLGYSSFKILDNVQVLGTFDEEGNEIEPSISKIIDTILVCVTPDEAKEIYLLKDFASFGITEL